MAFEFVDSTSIDSNARRRIRSHVMKGKNLGKKKPHKPKPVVVKRFILQNTTLKTANNEELSKSPDVASVKLSNAATTTTIQYLAYLSPLLETPIARVERPVEVPRPPCIEMSLWPMPIEFTPLAQKEIHSFLSLVSTALYPPEFCQPEDLAKSIWIQYMFVDEGYFHTTLALSVLYVNAFAARPSGYEQAVPHLARACSLVNQKISSGLAISDLTIATVLSLSIYERLMGNYDIGSIHLQGMKRMIELRGGISKFPPYDTLVQKTFRADIELSLHFGTLPLFAFDDIPGQEILTNLQCKLFDDHPYDPSQFPFLLNMNHSIQDVFFDVLGISHYLKTNTAYASKLRPELFQAILIKVCYKLIGLFQTETEEPENNNQDLLHLSLTVFMTTFWFQYGQKSEMFPFLCRRFRKSIEVEFSNTHECQELLLWAALIGRGSMFTGQPHSWSVLSFRKLAHDMDLRTWEDIRHSIQTLPWVKILHEKAGKQFFASSITGCGIQLE